MNVVKFVTFMIAFSAMWLSASMIDDMEDGNYQNEIGFNWSYFVNCCDSELTITNAIVDERGRLGMMPVAGIGYDEGYAAELSWIIGSKSSECTVDRQVSLISSLAFDSDDGIGWEKATEISFYAKSNSTLTTRVEFTTSGAPNYGRFFKDITVNSEWAKYTVKFADLSQYASAAEVIFFASAIIKLEFIILADLEGTPDSGSLFIDDVSVDDTVISNLVNLFDVESEDPGKVNEVPGMLLAHFEGGNQGEMYGPEVTLFKTRWYLFDDSELAGVKNSVFTDGIQIDPADSAQTVHITIGGKDGFDSTQGMKVSFKLGHPIRNAENVTQPYVGIGCMLSNSDAYASGRDSTLKTTNADSAKGIYFDYKTVSTNEKFEHFNFELYDTDTLPDGLSFHESIPVTNGVWRSATVLFNNLSFIDATSELFNSLTSAQRSLDLQKLDRMLFRFQNIKETGIDVCFDNFKFLGTVETPFGYIGNTVSPLHRSRATISYLMSNNGLQINLGNLPAGAHTGTVELIGINGKVIAKELLPAAGDHALSMKTDKMSTGVYILKVTTRYGKGKTYSFTDRVSIVH